MTEDQRNHFRELLEKQRDELNRSIEEDQARARETPEGVNDVGDTSVQTLLNDTALTLGDRRSTQVFEVDRALERLERGEYGQCEACGEDIDPRRLEAVPTTVRCTECAAQTEDVSAPTL